MNFDAILRGVDLRIRKGELLAVSGPVGAGKSSLIYSILRENYLLEGSLKIAPETTMSFASQEPFLLQDTI